MSQQATTSSLEQYVAYPYHTDQIYQQGIASILGNDGAASNMSAEEREDMLRRTRVFYFNKTTGNSLTVDEARAYEISLEKDYSSQPQLSAVVPSPSATQDTSSLSTHEERDAEPRVLTFAEIKELIETGRLDQIPNNKSIPNTLNEAPPSQSTAQARRKPWEVASQASDTMSPSE